MKTGKLAIAFIALFFFGSVLTPAVAAGKGSGHRVNKNLTAVLDTTMGTIKIGFYPDVAPLHVSNFIMLAKSGFYDGTYFHRVIPGFVVQGGDPNTKDNDRSNDGMGGPESTVKAEFNNIHHGPGIVSMARKRNPNSAGSQFFICVGDLPDLDHKYTVFGKVTEGMDVVYKIADVPRDRNDNPIENVVVRKVTIIDKR